MYNILCRCVHVMLFYMSKGAPADLLKFVGAKSVGIPDQYVSAELMTYVLYWRVHKLAHTHIMLAVSSPQRVNERLQKGHIRERLKSLESGEGVNWATAEALAIGTLLYQGGLLVLLNCMCLFPLSVCACFYLDILFTCGLCRFPRASEWPGCGAWHIQPPPRHAGVPGL